MTGLFTAVAVGRTSASVRVMVLALAAGRLDDYLALVERDRPDAG